MVGAILQLVANGAQNQWLDHQPQITFFKKIYRRHTPFAFEQIVIFFKNPIYFGSCGSAYIPPQGDLLYRLFLVFKIPKLAAIFLNSKSTDITNLLIKSTLSDNIFANVVKKYIFDSKQIDINQITNLLQNRLVYYNQEEDVLLKILNTLNTQTNLIEVAKVNNDFFEFKMNLANEWLIKKTILFNL